MKSILSQKPRRRTAEPCDRRGAAGMLIRPFWCERREGQTPTVGALRKLRLILGGNWSTRPARHGDAGEHDDATCGLQHAQLFAEPNPTQYRRRQRLDQDRQGGEGGWKMAERVCNEALTHRLA